MIEIDTSWLNGADFSRIRSLNSFVEFLIFQIHFERLFNTFLCLFRIFPGSGKHYHSLFKIFGNLFSR